MRSCPHRKKFFGNLITNAIKYNDKPQKWVEIGYYEQDSLDDLRAPRELDTGCTLQTQQKFTVFYVCDNGIGIQEKHQDAIFRIFKRLHGRDRFGGGMGAGLTIVKKIVERHQGRIWVESTYGEGSTFHFMLGGGNSI